MKATNWHLWMVKCVGPTLGLWIVTRRESMEDALEKARVVLKQGKQISTIKSVKYRGTIDA